MLGDVRRTLAAVAIEPRAEPPPSIDLPDLIRWMAGKGRPEIAMACASGLIKQLKDQQRSWRYLEGLCQDVTRGTLDPESLATPLEKTLSQIANGRKIPNPAGYWNESVKAWQRDHAGRASF